MLEKTHKSDSVLHRIFKFCFWISIFGSIVGCVIFSAFWVAVSFNGIPGMEYDGLELLILCGSLLAISLTPSITVLIYHILI